MRMAMPPLWSRSELLELIADWKQAYKACSTGKAYTIAGRSLTRYDLPEIRAQLDYLQKELAALDGRRRPFFVQARFKRNWA